MFGHDATQPQSNDGMAPGAPISPAPTDAATPPAPDMPADPAVTHPADPASSTPSSPNDGHTDDLLDIKQEALKQLSPLVSHLDQSPEEKFRTTMMMIQAADDQSLIKQAYDAAQNISDEKARAQALLDIINEINYFTQHKEN